MAMEIKSPRASIIIIAYNEEEKVERAIKSVCDQTVRELELICVDDGSTDGTYEHMLQCASRDRRIKIIRQTNSGTLAARYAGIMQASGKYTMFLDADDRLLPEAVQTACDAADFAGADVLEFGVRIVKNLQDPPSTYTYSWLSDYFSQKKAVPSAVQGPDLINACFCEHAITWNLWNKVFQTGLIRDAVSLYQGEWLALTEDMLITLMVLSRARHYARIQAKLYEYTIGGGLSTRPAALSSPKEVKDAATAWQSLTLARKWLRSTGYPQEKIADSLAAIERDLREGTVDRLSERCAPRMRKAFLRWLSQCCTEEEYTDLICVCFDRQKEGSARLEEIIRQSSEDAQRKQLSISRLEEERQRLLENEARQRLYIGQLEAQNHQLQESYDTISNAFFWKVTKPFRLILDFLKQLF